MRSGRQEATSDRSSLRRGGVWVAVASNAANVSLIALNLGLVRLLDTGQYGAVAALLGVNLVGTVPGLALQVVLARRTATAPADREHRGALWTVLLAWSGAIAVGMGLLAAVMSPVVTSLLHLDSVTPVLWMAASLVPFVLVSAVQGLLQGAERFAALAVSLGLVGLGKLAGGVGGAPWGVAGVLAGTAVCALVAAVASLALVAGDLRRPGPRDRAGGADRPGRPGPTEASESMVTELRGATSGMLGLFALQNLDVVLARHLLPAHQSGVYAAGSLTAKGVFWLLHVVAVVVFPRLSDPDRRKDLLRRAFWLVSGTAVLATLLATVTGPTMLPFVFGADYRTLGVVAGVFALVGSLVALAELLLYANLAVRGHRISWGVWAAMAGFVGLVYAVGHRTVAGIAWLDALCLTLLVGYGVLVERPGLARLPRQRPQQHRADAPEG